MKTTQFIIPLVLLGCYLQVPTVFGDSKSLLDAWTKIKTNYANDLLQSNTIYKQIKDEQQALEELRFIVERHLRTKNAEILANVIGSNNVSLSEDKIKETMANITDSYDKQMVEGILAEAMDEIILMRKLSQMPDLLWNIYQNSDLKLFEIMLTLQVQLYSSSSSRYHTDEKEFLQKFSYILNKIKNDRLFSSMNLDLKLNVQNIIEKLPNNLKFLYFTPYFCLVNEKYEKYIYAAIEAKVDAVSRYIWLWHDSKSMDDTGYIKAQVTEYNSTYTVTLKSTKYQMYYYMLSGTRKIAGWDTSASPSNHIWNIEFVDNERVVFSQNKYIMCAVEAHDNERRNVAGRKKGEVSSMTPECQWRLGACIFR